MKLLLFLTLFITLTGSCQTDSGRSVQGKMYAEEELAAALLGKGHNLVDDKAILIKDSVTAVAIVEPVLFNIYQKENILGQRPYEVYHLDHYWVVSGTMPKESLGGTFLVIIDDRNGKLLRITHGK